MTERQYTELRVEYGPNKWQDLEGLPLVTGRIERAVFMPDGTHLGNPSVEILVRTKGGLYVHANTTWKLWSSVSALFEEWNRDGPHQNTEGGTPR